MRMEKSRENYNAAAAAVDRVRITVPAGCAGLRLDLALARLFPAHSRNRLARWVRDGRVTVDGRVLAPRHKLAGGEAIEPELRALWRAHGAKTAGTWAEVFGAAAPGQEVFTAWHYALYADAVAQAMLA